MFWLNLLLLHYAFEKLFGKIMALEDAHTRIPRIWKYVSLLGKKDSADVIELEILR